MDYQCENIILKAEIERLRNRLAELESAIRKVVTQRADDICWRDVYTDLAKLVGFDFCPDLICEPEQHLANCCMFIHSLRTGKYTPIFVEPRK